MRILITGVLGTVGSLLKDTLILRGHNVFGIDLYHSLGETGFSQTMSSEEDTYCRCDISEFRQLERVIEKYGPFDIVFNCAAEFGRWNGEDYYEQLWKTNAIGFKHILRLQEKLNFKLVHFSSSLVYGDYDGEMIESITDDIEIKQMNDYGISKWVNEMQIANSRVQYNTQTVIVRLFNTYGPGEHYNAYRSVNAKFCYHAINNLPITLYTGHYRTSTYLYDTVNTISNIVDNFINGRIYNIGSNEYHSIEELVNIIWDYTGANRSLITLKDSEILTTKTKTPNIQLSINELGHKNTVSLIQGVHNTIDWMRQNQNLNKK